MHISAWVIVCILCEKLNRAKNAVLFSYTNSHTLLKDIERPYKLAFLRRKKKQKHFQSKPRATEEEKKGNERM